MEKNIIKIITFFDLFNYPLTSFELLKYINEGNDLTSVLHVLENSSDLIQQKNGFYFLPGREEIVNIRQKRYNYTNNKLKIAKRFSYFFRLLPFIKVICISNSIGSHNLREGSDIDFFIITSPRRIWLSRLFCAGFAKIMYSRPTQKNKKDKICLSFYISEDHLNLDDLRLENEDPYFDYWIRGLVLLYNKNRVYENFLVANKLQPGDLLNREVRKSFFGDYFEKIAKRWQLKIMSPELKGEMNNSDGVVINDTTLKLYLYDRRREFLKNYNNKLHEIFKKNN